MWIFQIAMLVFKGLLPKQNLFSRKQVHLPQNTRPSFRQKAKKPESERVSFGEKAYSNYIPASANDIPAMRFFSALGFGVLASVFAE